MGGTSREARGMSSAVNIIEAYNADEEKVKLSEEGANFIID